jgi:hypothetical protein
MFHLDVAKIDLVLHVLQRLYTYVASVCFNCFKRMLQVFCLNIAYVAAAIHVCCKCMFQVFHLFKTYVASVSSICCNVAYVSYICYKHLFKMFHLFQTYVAKYVYLNVVVAIHICCKRMFAYASPISDVCCRNTFRLQH